MDRVLFANGVPSNVISIVMRHCPFLGMTWETIDMNKLTAQFLLDEENFGNSCTFNIIQVNRDVFIIHFTPNSQYMLWNTKSGVLKVSLNDYRSVKRLDDNHILTANRAVDDIAVRDLNGKKLIRINYSFPGDIPGCYSGCVVVIRNVVFTCSHSQLSAHRLNFQTNRVHKEIIYHGANVIDMVPLKEHIVLVGAFQGSYWYTVLTFDDNLKIVKEQKGIRCSSGGRRIGFESVIYEYQTNTVFDPLFAQYHNFKELPKEPLGVYALQGDFGIVTDVNDMYYADFKQRKVIWRKPRGVLQHFYPCGNRCAFAYNQNKNTLHVLQ